MCFRSPFVFPDTWATPKSTSARRSAEKRRQLVIDGRVLRHLHLGSKRFSAEPRLEILAPPRQRDESQLRIELSHLVGRHGYIPRVHNQVTDVLPQGPRCGELSKSSCLGSLGASGTPHHEKLIRRADVRSQPIATNEVHVRCSPLPSA